MNLLLDTHIWLWWINQSEELPTKHVDLIENAERVYVSAISCWEVALLKERQRIELPITQSKWFQLALQQAGIICLPLTHSIAIQAASLSHTHRDPADRFIIATALEHQLHIMSFDAKFPYFSELAPYLVGRKP